jgi:hypothetical protein
MNTLVFTLFGAFLSLKSSVPEGFIFIGNHIKNFCVHVFQAHNKVTSFMGVTQYWIPFWLAFFSGRMACLNVDAIKRTPKSSCYENFCIPISPVIAL